MKNVLICFCLLLISCEKRELAVDVNSGPDTTYFIRKTLGITLLNALKNELFCNKLLEEMDLQKNPDSGILWAAFYNKPYDDKWSILDFIYTKNRLFGERYYPKKILIQDPELDLFIFNPTTYETDRKLSTEDLIAIDHVIIIDDQVDENSEFLDYFDENGVLSKRKANQIPTKPTLIVRNNVDLIPVNPKTGRSYKGNHYPHIKNMIPVFVSPAFSYYSAADVLNQKEIILENRSPSAGGNCTRDILNKWDELHAIRWTSCSNFMARTGFWEGACRLRTHIVYVKKVGADIGIESIQTDIKPLPHRHFAKFNLFGCVSTNEFNIAGKLGTINTLNWDLATIGTPVKYIWFEVDESDINGTLVIPPFAARFNDNRVEFPTNATSTIDIGKRNDNLGEAFVEYCDNIFHLPPYKLPGYNTGSIIFSVR
jgi:hypothetical protein